MVRPFQHIARCAQRMLNIVNHIAAGARFGQPASGSILFVDRVAILFEEKHFSVRWNGRHELWDDDANTLLGYVTSISVS